MKNGSVRMVTKRFVLQAGFSCNARCRFCYYKESLRKGTVTDLPTGDVKARLREGRKRGKTMVDLSGGEPTIRSDIVDIVCYARGIGYHTVCLITNGIRLADKSFRDELVSAGMNDTLFSIHSSVAKDHDWLTGVPGSFDKITSALGALSGREGVTVRVNSTISGYNCDTLDGFFEFLRPFRPDAVNILVLNPSQETLRGREDQPKIEDYGEVASAIARAIEIHGDAFPAIHVRWLPFCLLKGHEGRIRTMWQKMYEDQEWDPYLNIKYNKGVVAVWGSFIGGCLLYPFRSPRYGRRDRYTLFNEIITTFRGICYYRRTAACRRCSLRKICPGFARSYARRFGMKGVPLQAYNLGEVIEDPLHFCGGSSDTFESLRIGEGSG